MLQLDVASLKKSPGDSARFDLTATLHPLELLGENISFSGPVKAGLDVTNTGKTLAVEGEVSGNLKLTCSRCLKPFDYIFDVLFREIYTPVQGEGGEEAVLFTGDVIDVTPEVLKSIILVLPMKAICREECQGLCPQCGRNLNEGRCNCEKEHIDPRLSVLKKLLNKNDE